MHEPMRRDPSTVLLARTWELRATLRPSDAVYVVAEALGGTLLTTNARLAETACRAARIGVFPG